jgi:phosphoglycolate phosphatase
MVADDYDFWLLDLDGTLVDVEESYVHDVCRRVGERLGTPFTASEREVLWYGLGDRQVVYDRHDVSEAEFWRLFHEEEDPVARAEATYLHDDGAFVADLDVPVGLVTHCQDYLTMPVLEHLDIADWFDAVVCCDDDLGWKPDPAPVERAMRDIGVLDHAVATDGGQAARGVLAGDQVADVGAAWNVGLDAIHVERHGHQRRGQCVMGDYRVQAFTDLF